MPKEICKMKNFSVIGDKKLRQDVYKVVHNIALKYKPQKIVLFGSMARGDYHEGSDIDMMLIKDTNKKFGERIGGVILLNNTMIPLEPVIYNQKEFDSLLNEGRDFAIAIKKDGVILYEQRDRNRVTAG